MFELFFYTLLTIYFSGERIDHKDFNMNFFFNLPYFQLKPDVVIRQ